MSGQFQQAATLWDGAYDQLKAEEGDLVEEYESIVSSYSKACVGVNPLSHRSFLNEIYCNGIAQNDRQARRAQMDKIIRIWLEEPCQAEDNETDEDSETWHPRKILPKTVPEALQASLAWFTSCLAVEVCG